MKKPWKTMKNNEKTLANQQICADNKNKNKNSLQTLILCALLDPINEYQWISINEYRWISINEFIDGP